MTTRRRSACAALSLVFALVAGSAGAAAQSPSLAWNDIRPGMTLAEVRRLPPGALTREAAPLRCEAAPPADSGDLPNAMAAMDGDLRCRIADVHPLLPTGQSHWSEPVSPWHCDVTLDFVGTAPDLRLSRMLLGCSNVATAEMIAWLQRVFGPPTRLDTAPSRMAVWEDGDTVLMAGTDEGEGAPHLTLESRSLRRVPIERAVAGAKSRL